MNENLEHFFLDARLLHRVRGQTFRAILPNGHPFIAHAALQDHAEFSLFQEGETVCVEMSPYDMSQGRIVLPKHQVLP